MKSLWFLFLLPSVIALGQSPDYKQEAIDLKNGLLKYHVEPKTIDDQFSVEVFDFFLDALDPDKVFFTKREIDELAQWRMLIDDELSGRQWTFIERARSVFHNALLRYRTNISLALSSSLVWNKGEYFERKPQQWCTTEDELKSRTVLWAKYLVVKKLAWYMQRDSTASPQYQKYQKDAVALVKRVEEKQITKQLSNANEFHRSIARYFFYAVTSIFDPHTIFLSATDFEQFQSMLSTEGYYFGFTLESNLQGDVLIGSLAPGGPAWNSGLIDVSDVIVGIHPKGSELVDVAGFSLSEVNDVLDDIAATEVEFILQKAGGIIKKVSLRKEKILLEEQFVRSFVLNGPKKIGYIHLPDFYTSWGGSKIESSRCANDVAKEIVKLKQEGMDGLILDVRFNGGGSLYEAIAMTGIFIDQGAVGMMKERSGPMILKDINRGTIYDGPLALMVNGQSASASELLAAALQDYNRAIIVGSRTFGKGSGQAILPLKEGIPTKNVSFIKVTTERLYRVTGASVQGKGVVPDVELPDVFSARPVGEEQYPFALENDSLPKKSFYKPLPAITRTQLKARSAERIATNEELQRQAKVFQTYANLVTQDKILLDEEGIERMFFVRKSMNSSSMSSSNNNIFKITSNHFDSRSVDTFKQDLNARWFKKLQSDHYLIETYQILLDLIQITSTP